MTTTAEAPQADAPSGDPDANRPAGASTLQVWDRATGQRVDERIYGEKWLRFAYENPLGSAVHKAILKRRAVSFALGFYFSSGLSCDQIQPFVEELGIDLDDYEEKDWKSFNEFFRRAFKEGRRPFPTEPWVFPAFAEGRYLAYDRVDKTQTFPVKGYWMTATQILGDPEQGKSFQNGPCFIARLAPQDYHRFHYPDGGNCIGCTDIGGPLDSVHPIALKNNSPIWARNRRRAWIMTTNNFGRLAFVEIGAWGVGKIKQTHDPETNFARGDEKGYFEYGGSTIVVFGEPGKWSPDRDLVEKSAEKMETFVRLGEPVATSTRRRAERGKPVELGNGETYRVFRG